MCGEPDWGTFVVASSDREIGQQVERAWRDSFRNPFIGRTLFAYLQQAGLTDVDVNGFTLAATGFASADMVFDIAATAERVRAREPDRGRQLNANAPVFLLLSRSLLFPEQSPRGRSSPQPACSGSPARNHLLFTVAANCGQGGGL